MSVTMATMFAMLIRTVTTQMVLTFVPARKDTLETDIHVKVNKNTLHFLKQAALHINRKEKSYMRKVLLLRAGFDFFFKFKIIILICNIHFFSFDGFSGDGCYVGGATQRTQSADAIISRILLS